MASGIYVAMSAAHMQEQRLDTLSNNLANAMTPGFKKHRAIYKQVHNDVTKMGDPNQAMGLHHPVRFLPEDRLPGQLDERFTEWRQGPLKVTENPMDVAIEGDGFLVVQAPDGPAYTRNGTLRRALDGTLVTQEGFPFLDRDGQTIQVPGDAQALRISPEGIVQAGEDQIGQLALVTFDDLQGMLRMGNSNWRPADPNAQPAASTARLEQGYLESSNVNPVFTMTSMIKANRVFEMNTKALQAYKAMDDSAIRDVGRDR